MRWKHIYNERGNCGYAALLPCLYPVRPSCAIQRITVTLNGTLIKGGK